LFVGISRQQISLSLRPLRLRGKCKQLSALLNNCHLTRTGSPGKLPDTFFYLDPPYYGCENYYGDGIFSKENFGKLRNILDGLKGKFILSINDHPQTREIFKGFGPTY